MKKQATPKTTDFSEPRMCCARLSLIIFQLAPAVLRRTLSTSLGSRARISNLRAWARGRRDVFRGATHRLALLASAPRRALAARSRPSPRVRSFLHRAFRAPRVPRATIVRPPLPPRLAPRRALTPCRFLPSRAGAEARGHRRGPRGAGAQGGDHRAHPEVPGREPAAHPGHPGEPERRQARRVRAGTRPGCSRTSCTSPPSRTRSPPRGSSEERRREPREVQGGGGGKSAMTRGGRKPSEASRM